MQCDSQAHHAVGHLQFPVQTAEAEKGTSEVPLDETPVHMEQRKSHTIIYSINFKSHFDPYSFVPRPPQALALKLGMSWARK